MPLPIQLKREIGQFNLRRLQSEFLGFDKIMIFALLKIRGYTLTMVHLLIRYVIRFPKDDQAIRKIEAFSIILSRR